MRHYYAFLSPYGIRAAYGPTNCPAVHIFDREVDRDAWVKADQTLQREACTAKEAEPYRDDRTDVVHRYVCPAHGGDIAGLRHNAGLTQLQLATAAGINPRMVQHLESGERKAENTTLKVAIALADALGVDVRELL